MEKSIEPCPWISSMSLDLFILLHSEMPKLYTIGLSEFNRVNKIFLIQPCPWITLIHG